MEIHQQRLPERYLSSVERYLMPLADKIAALKVHRSGALLVGIQGAQGTGKSTTASFISLILHHTHNINAVCLSLDDFYLTKAEREKLGREVHPLLETRGVPGTHDIALALSTINQLKKSDGHHEVLIPRFDKARDDRKPIEQWDVIQNRVDVILLEGWCVAAEPVDESALVDPINTLEATSDSSGVWRNWVNEQLQNEYQVLFGLIDYLVVLQAPSFDVIYEWRLLQEQKLKDEVIQYNGDLSAVMDDDQIARFIQHYERITLNNLKMLPDKADCLLKLDRDHQIYEMQASHRPRSFMIVTDLDGTLLDHYDYSFDAAMPALKVLKSRTIPLILNTSKTYAEVVGIKSELGIDTPCIVENGSAIYLPEAMGERLSDDLKGELTFEDDHYVHVFGEPREEILTVLDCLKEQYGYQFEGFSDYDVNALVAKTGLAPDRAEQALNRHFSEPVIWCDSDERYQAFLHDIERHGLMLLRGGRFIHVLGRCDKGRSLSWLKSLYRAQRGEGKTPIVVALGDSQNDSAMLSVADIAVAVKSPVHEFPDINNPQGRLIYTTKTGPGGWNEAILEILQ
ncbi:HAD-IIB family hydrolase [Alkalimarinus coralli]|uniref:HAD-IIB family hydrolase n=1 Tax=Alkalimarinus coralli TaxID=2935863 RepID=UPI00202B7509|nr:HAD-IIB family hydrolase [Alkalimarinus coralli]